MKNYAVLIIDDNKLDRYILKRQLKDAGIDGLIFEHDNGSSAFEFLRNYSENTTKYPEEFPPRMIFLDINMPIMNGLEFLEHFSKLRSEIDMHTTIVIMMTSSEQEQDKAKALSFAFVRDYMTKGSFSKEMLKSQVDTFLQV